MTLQIKINSPSSSPPGQPQQAVTQIGHGLPAATVVPGSTPAHTAAAQRAAATAPGQSPVTAPQATRPQQGQVKLTMAQLMQLTQGAQVRDFFFPQIHKIFSCFCEHIFAFTFKYV